MRKIRTSDAESKYIGTLPMGCQQCIRGEKLVLFVTGLCGHSCHYCPLSSKRKSIDKTWANETPVEKDEDIIAEAKLCSSAGAGITGGDPLLRLEKTLGYIRLLKSTFGKDFHIHLYTSGNMITKYMLKDLEEAGLDELRLHLREDHTLIDKCIGYRFDIGAEVPVVPGKEKDFKALILHLEKSGAKFLNLNELEMSELNFEKMTASGLEPNCDIFNTVKGSRKLGLKLLKFAQNNTKNLNIHLCTSGVKNIYQYQNRLKNRAKNIIKPFERLVDHCLIEKGVIETNKLDLESAKKDIISRLHLKDKDLCMNMEKNRLEVSKKTAMQAKKLGYTCSIVKEFPTSDSFDVEKDPL